MPKWLQPDRSGGPQQPSRRASPWHAVSIVLCQECCSAARLASNTRFLSAQAPRLPLVDCASPQTCTCSYRHHNDRRVQPRRRDELVGLRRKGYVAQERRSWRGRREEDLP